MICQTEFFDTRQFFECAVGTAPNNILYVDDKTNADRHMFWYVVDDKQTRIRDFVTIELSNKDGDELKSLWKGRIFRATFFILRGEES